MSTIHIRGGEWSAVDGVVGYRAEMIGDLWVERAVHTNQDAAHHNASDVTGGIRYRFWQSKPQLLVERHFALDGVSLGTCAYTVLDLRFENDSRSASVSPLRVWINNDGLVTLRGEMEFEHDVCAGVLSAAEAATVERALRQITSGIAKGTYPPPIIRRWQVDVQRIRQQILSPAEDSARTAPT